MLSSKNAMYMRLIFLVSLISLSMSSFSSMTEVMAFIKIKPQSFCHRIWDDRYYRYGLFSDWKDIHNCAAADTIWWALELKPRKRIRFLYTLPSEKEDFFTFSPTFFDEVNRFVNPVYKGPPKWMPPDLAYWDAYIGDWRYSRRRTGADIYAQLSQPELLMLWVRYDQDGINIEATFDYNRLSDFIDLSAFKSISTEFSEFLGSE